MNLYIKGIIIGVGKILPGISGSVLAISLGEYEKIVESITNIKEQIRERKTYLLKIGLGVITAIAILSKVIVKCLNTYYFATILLLIGMISGDTLKKFSKMKNAKEKKWILILTVIMIIIQIIRTENKKTLDLKEINNREIQYTLLEFIILTGIGAIDAVASIIPGISGTALLMITGYYNNIITAISTIFDYKRIEINAFIMIPFCIGFIITLITVSKILNTIIKKHKKEINVITTAFMIVTIFTLLKTTLPLKKTMSEYITGTMTISIGFLVTKQINKRKKVKQQNII